MQSSSLSPRPPPSSRLSSRSSTSSTFSRASTLSRASIGSDASFSSSFSHLSNTSTCSSSITSFTDFTDPFELSEYAIPEGSDEEEDDASNYEKSLPPTPQEPTQKPFPPIKKQEADSPFLDTHSPHLNLFVPWIRISIISSGHASIFLLTASTPSTLDSQSIHLSLLSSPPKVVYEEKRLKGSGPPSWEKKKVFDLQTERGKTVSDIVNVVRGTKGLKWDGEWEGEGDGNRGGRGRCKGWVAEVLAELQTRGSLHKRSVVCARTVGCTLAHDKGGEGVCC